jgi:anti-sigma regulatory factor (Ser/Thr protein kinase)
MKKKLTFLGDTCELAGVRRAAREFFHTCGYDECEAELLVVAIDEACTNVIRHAYHNTCRPVRLSLDRRRDGSLEVVLRDYGTPCDPTKIRGRTLGRFRPGGLGVHFIRRAFDEVHYLPQPRGTRLVMRKLPPGGAGARQKKCL